MKHPDGLQVLIAIDQLFNTFIGGYADETISSYAHRKRLKGKPWLARLIDALFFWCARQGALLEVKVLRSTRHGVRSSDSTRASRQRGV